MILSNHFCLPLCLALCVQSGAVAEIVDINNSKAKTIQDNSLATASCTTLRVLPQKDLVDNLKDAVTMLEETFGPVSVSNHLHCTHSPVAIESRHHLVKRQVFTFFSDAPESSFEGFSSTEPIFSESSIPGFISYWSTFENPDSTSFVGSDTNSYASSYLGSGSPFSTESYIFTTDTDVFITETETITNSDTTTTETDTITNSDITTTATDTITNSDTTTATDTITNSDTTTTATDTITITNSDTTTTEIETSTFATETETTTTEIGTITNSDTTTTEIETSTFATETESDFTTDSDILPTGVVSSSAPEATSAVESTSEVDSSVPAFTTTTVDIGNPFSQVTITITVIESSVEYTTSTSTLENQPTTTTSQVPTTSTTPPHRGRHGLSKRDRNIVIGVVVGVGGLLIILATALAFWGTGRRNKF